ncbi:MAG: O-antigen ligase family protein [Parcubacteria group bacterium]|jgi:hypothetical protein
MLSEIFNKLNRPKTYLLLANIFGVLFLIVLSNLHILPIKNLGDFIFFTVVYLAFALYRPGWSFLFFVGTIALENINLAPKEIGIMVRPYQFIGGLTIAAVLIKLAVKRLGFRLPQWNWYDLLFVIFTVTGFLSALFAPDKGVSFKQSIIAASFVALYFLARIFIQNSEDLKRVAPFFLSSSLIVVLYGIWQNIRFIYGNNSFEVMPGRPNATFTEPDWLGIYLVLLLAVIYAVIYHCHSERSGAESKNLIDNPSRSFDKPAYRTGRLRMTSLYILLTLTFILLILTVSRSAWLGAFAVTFIYLFVIWTNLKWHPKNWEWKTTLQIKIPIIISLFLAFTIVYIFNLTNFQLFNRAQSTGGLQKITISCDPRVQLLDIQELNSRPIGNVSELEKYGCRHINLEEIDQERSQGNFVTEIFRTDPNVNIRGIIYQKSWNTIKDHPILGIGWGSIGQILGTDENGTSLNSSNIFLEVWLGSGLLGILVLAFILLYSLISGLRNFSTNDRTGKILGLCALLGLFALIIPNLFNAGIFLGIVWLFLAVTTIKQ